MKRDEGFDPCFMIKIKKLKKKCGRGDGARDAKKEEKKRKREADSERGRKGEKEIHRKIKKGKQSLKN